MLGKIIGYEMKGQSVEISFSQGVGTIEIVTDKIINVYTRVTMKGHRSKAVLEDAAKDTNFNVSREDQKITIETDSLMVVVWDEFYVDFYKKDGTLLCADYRGERTLPEELSPKFLALMAKEGHDVHNSIRKRHRIEVVKKMEGDEAFYGLGDKTGYLNKKNYEYQNWNSDIPFAHTEAMKALYKSIPFFVTLRKRGTFGIFFDNTYRTWFDMGKESEDYYFFAADEGNLDYYFIYGDDLPAVVEGYTAFTGRTPLPQLWTLGHHQSRWGYEKASDVREIARKYRELQIPCDAIHLDIDYMDGYRVFTWDEDAFEKKGELLREIGEQGFKTICIIDPGVKKDEDYAVYREGVQNGYFVKTPSGKTYINEVWPGEAAFPDFGNPYVRKWWASKQNFLLRAGARGVWNDMNEPACFSGDMPEEIVFSDEEEESNHARMHNVYGHLMDKATYEGLKEQDGRRPFVLTRACYSGTQRFAAVWTGDNQSLWPHLQMMIPQLCNLGLSGFALAGADVGGFGEDATPELMARWVEAGSFCPFFRNHASKNTMRQEPWYFNKEIVDIYRKYVTLRYQWLPYYYDLFRITEKCGYPVMRPLVFHYEKDDNVRNLNDEFLLGENVLVAPVVEQGSTKKLVYLPEGEWYDYWTGEYHVGARYFLKDAPLDVCPVFVKAGSILPGFTPMQYVGETEREELILTCYPGTGEYVHYQDNGEDFSYRNGRYNEYRICQSEGGTVRVELAYHGYEKRYSRLCLRYMGREKRIPWNGNVIEENLKLL